MVAEMSNQPDTYIWEQMDIVVGLHYVMLWWQKRRIETLSMLDSNSETIV